MIRTLSPYYVDVSWVTPSTLTCTSYTLDIYIHEDIAILGTPYTITKKNYEELSSGSDAVDISKIVNSLITFTPLYSLVTGRGNQTSQKWITVKVGYATGDLFDDDPVTILQTLATKGYNFGMDFRNAEASEGTLLTPPLDYKVGRDSTFFYPMLTGTTDVTVAVKSFPANTLNFTTIMSDSTLASQMVKVIAVKVAEAINEDYIEIQPSIGNIVTLLITDECRYEPLDIVFFNRDGAQQSLTFFKSRTDNMTVTDEQYQTSFLQPTDRYHQYQRYNINARTNFKCSSGFVDEEMNIVFKELLLSSKVWAIEGDKLVPVNVASKAIEYKTRAKDRLINYEIEFEYAFNEINNV